MALLVPLEPATLGPAPALVGWADSARGTVLLLHGLGAHALANHRELELLVRAGYCVAGLDLPGHGSRHDPEREHRWAADRDAELCRLALGAGHELPAVVDGASHAGLPRPYGIVGISLGAYAAWAGLLREARIRAAALLLGSPELPHHESPHWQAPMLIDRAILAINAEHDEHVPLGPTREVIARLDPRLAALRLIPGAGHAIPEADWWVAWGRVLEFFDTHL